MSENEIIKQTENTFESIKHVNENGIEFWYARELMISLEYSSWDKFKAVIEKAKISCKNSGSLDTEHFSQVGKSLNLPNGAIKYIEDYDYKLTRYACYLIAQNGSPRKKTVALAQTYFAVQTRKQELTEEEYKQLGEDDRRLYNRNLARTKNSALSDIAQKRGVENFAKFHNAGYIGLYKETAGQIKQRKGLKKNEDILDFMGSEELGANIFRITQTEAKLKKTNMYNEDLACATHNYIGKAVRRAIQDMGGTMPEDLPTPQKSVKELEKEKKKQLKLAEQNKRKLDK